MYFNTPVPNFKKHFLTDSIFNSYSKYVKPKLRKQMVKKSKKFIIIYYQKRHIYITISYKSCCFITNKVLFF